MEEAVVGVGVNIQL